MVVQVEVDLLLGTLFCNGIQHLIPMSAGDSQRQSWVLCGSHLKTSRAIVERRILLDDFIEHLGAILLAKRIHECFLDGNILEAIVEYLINHLDGISQPDRIDAYALELADDGLN